MKVCCRCKAPKPLAEFGSDASRCDGLRVMCRACTASSKKAYRESHVEAVRASDRARGQSATRKQAMRGRLDRNSAAHPERLSARKKVQDEVRAGRLERQPCFMCGDAAEAHHPDYSSPLSVVWLCKPHHRQAHQIV